MADVNATAQDTISVREEQWKPIRVTETASGLLNAWAVTVTDSTTVTVTDVASGAVSLQRTATETSVSVSDGGATGAVGVAPLSGSVTDTVTVREEQWRPIRVTDSATGAISLLSTTVSESAVTLSDGGATGVIGSAFDLSQTATDTVAVREEQWRPIRVTDSVTGVVTNPPDPSRTVTDTSVTVTDAYSNSLLTPPEDPRRSVTDTTVSVSEFVHTDLFSAILVTDSATGWIADGALTLSETAVSVTESLVGGPGSWAVAVTASVTVTDAISNGIVLTDATTTVSDSATGEVGSWGASATESSVTVTDTAAGTLGSFMATAAESLSVSDTISVDITGGWAVSWCEATFTATFATATWTSSAPTATFRVIQRVTS